MTPAPSVRTVARMTALPFASLDGAALVALRRGPHREAVTRELWRRLKEHGRAADGPVALGAAVGIDDRMVRRLLVEADAEGVKVPVGWERIQGGGAAKARAKNPRNAAKEAAPKKRQAKVK